jgi:CRISPR-associated protein Cas2
VARRRYLVAYDICDPRRLRRVCGVMESYGQRLQYSVFLCDLSLGERADLERAVLAVMDLTEDSVVQIDLGPPSACAEMRFLGRRRTLPPTGPQIV